MQGPSGRSSISKRHVAALAELILACVLLVGCDIFSLGGILDNPSSGSSLKLLPDVVNMLVYQQRKFTATGGSGGYIYTLQDGGVSGTINSSSGLYTALALGTDTIVVTDSAGDTCESTAMVTASVSLTITPVTITLGAGATVSFTASGGTASYTYSASGGSINSGTGFFTAPPNAGSVTVTVTDGTSTADAIVTVANPPTLLISPATATLNAGTTYTFTASGGVPLYSFSVTLGTGTIDAATGLFRAPSVAVIETDTVVVIDAGGGTRTASATVTILPSGSPLSINPSSASVDAGQTLSFTASGGTPPYTFSVVPGGGGSINSSSGLYSAPVSGGTATVRVTDAVAATSDSLVTINAPAPLQIAPTSLYLVTVGQTTFSATGGIPPYSYSVVPGGAGGTINSVSGLYDAPGVEGSDTVCVTDAGSHTSNASVTVYFPLTIVPTEATVQEGDTYSFDASGGVPGPGYAYFKVSGVGSMAPDGTYRADSGAGPAVVKVVDSLNNSSTATVTVTAVVTWTIQGIDTSARSGQYASLAISSTGVPQIAYYESKNKELRLEKLIGTTWTRQTVDTTGTVGQYASLALDAGANARISYYDASNKRLRYASWNGSSWTKQTVDSGGDLGKYSSLALDGSGNPRISYYDSGNKDLKYASWNGSSWTRQTVDSGGDVGMYSSLALDSTGKPRISYYQNDPGNKHLKFASWNGSSWIIETVDPGVDVGMYSSLALDAGGNPRISYYDNTGKDLKFASWGGSWVIEIVDNVGDVGMYSSLALDGSGNPHVSYYQNDNGNNKHLKYVSAIGTVWGAPQTVDTSGYVGMYSSLRYDISAGKARIAYYNSSSQDLKYAKEN